jgi:hypothetical protein
MMFLALSFVRHFLIRHPERSLRSEGSRPPRSGGAIRFNQRLVVIGDPSCES